MIAKLVQSKLLPFNNRYHHRTSGCRSHNGDNNSNKFLRGSQCHPNSSGDSFNKLHSGENPKDHHSKTGCKFNHHSSLPGHLREEIIPDLVDKSMRIRWAFVTLAFRLPNTISTVTDASDSCQQS